MNELTDLEGAALADVARHGPTTSYAVAKTFAESPSEFWSGSAGAVYPMIKRLEARGLLGSIQGIDGKRARTDYRITDTGRDALRAWLLDAGRAAGLGFDPLRTRAVHLDLVSAEERARFLDDVAERMRAMAQDDVWADEPRLRRIHESVLAAREAWLKVLDAMLR
jgi:DNA-binding PadR family transcriptional regulator